MARVYGKVQLKYTNEALAGTIMFEPKPIAYIHENVLFMRNSYTQVLDGDGGFDIDVAPGEYYVHINNGVREIEVPMVNEITLKELLKISYPQ